MSSEQHTMQLKLLSPKGPVGVFTIDSASIPTEKGYISIGKDYAPFIGLVSLGVITVKPKKGETCSFYTSGGFMEVFENKITVCLELVEPASEVDFKRAKASADRALQRLKDLSVRDLDIHRAMASLARAQARQKLEKLL